ncbi:hydroxyacid dehydrogenase [Candidatus Gottesmanbacteria bacterium]|nr:hydroxyacid dehydrogenase [Candidatus Gottesmanbacteria bacterium]
MRKILVSDAIVQNGIDFLKGKGFEVVLKPDITPEELVKEIGDYGALIVRSRTKVTLDVITVGKKLKVIGRAGSGLDNIDVAAAKSAGITVVNAPGANATSVAEHTMAVILNLFRNLIPVATALKAGRWEKKTYQVTELAGKTIGIVGFGHVGSLVAQLAAGFGMKILVTTRSQKSVPGALVPLEQLLRESDVITLHVPKSSETQSLIGKKELALMKKTSYLVNCSRGGVVDEEALVAALTNRQIAGAALDVFATEPLPADSPLLSLPNVILTPHVAGQSREAKERASLAVAQEVAAALLL